MTEEVLKRAVTNNGDSVWDLSKSHQVLVVFLRHFGCTFCRESLQDISKKRKEIEKDGTQVVFIHMTTNDVAEQYFKRYKLSDATHISDPECTLYEKFGLVKGNFTQLFGLTNWIRGFEAGVMKGNWVGKQIGDGFQMPGLFLIKEGKIINSYIHKLSSDRPDYVSIVNCCN